MSENRKRILFVDDEPNILEMLSRMLNPCGEDWQAFLALSADEALKIMAREDIDTVVSDIRMPLRDGFALLQAMQDDEKLRHIPVIMLTGEADKSFKRKAMDLGATDLLNKPVSREDLVARLRSALRLKAYDDQLSGRVELLDELVKERTQQLEATQREIVLRLAKACEYRDDDTGGHVVRVACYSRILGEACGMNSKALDLLYLTSPLHDVGKIGIPDNILLKPGKLEPSERHIIEQHPLIGKEILSSQPKAMATADLTGMTHLLSSTTSMKMDLLETASSIAEHHHEKWDGSGYPHGLAGENIPIEARIVAVADVYDALRSERPYKPAFPEEKAVMIVKEGSGHHFDAAIVGAFFQSFDEIRAVFDQFRDAKTPKLLEA